MKKIPLEIVSLSHSVSQSQNYAVVLSEVRGKRQLPIIIGSFEAQAIAVAVKNMVSSRPLTHDLFKNTLEKFNINLKEVVINNLVDGIFYAKLICEKDGDLVDIDSRTSDALALAVRFDCPIYTQEFILESAGIQVEEEFIEEEPVMESNFSSPPANSLAKFSKEDLNRMLEEVVQEEDYKRAAEIRDELKKRGA